MHWEEPNESIAANVQRVYDYATLAHQQCGHAPPALYTCNSRLAAKLQAIAGYPVVDLTAHQIISGPTNQPTPPIGATHPAPRRVLSR